VNFADKNLFHTVGMFNVPYRRFYLPSEGNHATDFYIAFKNQSSAGFEPGTLGPMAGTTRICCSKYPWAWERISLKIIDHLGTRSKKGSSGLEAMPGALCRATVHLAVLLEQGHGR
jgi:hypothetical protein